MKRKETFNVTDVEDFARIVFMSIFSEMMFKARKGREAEFDSMLLACNDMFTERMMAFMMGTDLLPKPNTAGHFISASRFYSACVVPNWGTITVATLPENHKEENKK